MEQTSAEPVWQTLTSTLIVDSPHLRVRCDRVRLPSGIEFPDWYTVEAADTAVIFALTPEREVVLVKIYRHSVGRWVYELPMGAVSQKSTPLATGLAELAEETGWRSKTLEAIGHLEFEPARSKRFCHFFFTDSITLGTRESVEEAENYMKVELVPLPKLLRMVQSGEIIGMPTVSAIYHVLTVKNLWPRP